MLTPPAFYGSLVKRCRDVSDLTAIFGASGAAVPCRLVPARHVVAPSSPPLGVVEHDAKLTTFLIAFDARTAAMPSRSSSRRQFLRRAGAALAAAPLARPALAQPKLRDVSMRLDWVFQGPNAGFMV